jgi:hypothetical protein
MRDTGGRVYYGIYRDTCGRSEWLADPAIGWHGDPTSPHCQRWLTFAAAAAYRNRVFPFDADVWVDSLGVFPDEAEVSHVPSM